MNLWSHRIEDYGPPRPCRPASSGRRPCICWATVKPSTMQAPHDHVSMVLSTQDHVGPRTRQPKHTDAQGHIGLRTHRPKAKSAQGHVGPRPRRPKATAAEGLIGPRPRQAKPHWPKITLAERHNATQRHDAKAASAQNRFGTRPLWVSALRRSLECLRQLRFGQSSLCKNHIGKRSL